MILIHEEKAEYDSWLKLLFIIPAGFFIAAIALSFYRDFESSLVLLGESVLFALIFYFIMPRKYQIYQDKLKIVLGTPFAINIPLSSIKEVKHSSGVKAFAYSGVRFATSSRYIVEIIRSKGMNYIISPQNGNLFQEQLTQVIQNRGRMQ